MWLVALVVARDAGIAAGWALIKVLGLPVTIRPLFLGKASTMVQILYILTVLLLLALDLDAPRLAQAAAWVCGLFAILSAAAYAWVFLRRILAGRPVAS
jgi:cardiolipin synthase